MFWEIDDAVPKWERRHELKLAVAKTGRNVAFGGGGSPPPPPDYSDLAASNRYTADKAAALGAEDLAFRKQVYADAMPLVRSQQELNSQLGQQYLNQSQKWDSRADDQWAAYLGQYAPLETQNVLDSLGGQYLTDEELAQTIDLLRPRQGLTINKWDGNADSTLLSADQQKQLVAAGRALDSARTSLTDAASKRSGLSADLVASIKDFDATTASAQLATLQRQREAVAADRAKWEATKASKGSKGTMWSRRPASAGGGAEWTQRLAQQESTLDSQITGLKTKLNTYDAVTGHDKASADYAAAQDAYTALKNQIAGSVNKSQADIDKFNADEAAANATRALTLRSMATRATERAGEQAATSATAASNAAMAASMRMLQRFGGDPTKMAAFTTQAATNTALANTIASNTAKQNVASGLQQQRVQQAATGRGNTATSMNAQGTGLNTAATAANATGTAANATMPAAGFVAGGFGTGLNAASIGLNANNSTGNMRTAGYNGELQAWQQGQQNNNAMWSAVGSLAGVGLGAYGAFKNR